MRLVSYRSGDAAQAGVLDGDRVTSAASLLDEEAPLTMRELLAADRLGELRQAVEKASGGKGEAIPLADLELLPPIPDPDKIVCIGLNYRSHAAEAGLEPPAVPTFFAKFRNALAPDGATIRPPAASRKVDYEAEVAFVVGRRAADVAVEDALGHIAGYTLLNDLSARDLQFATPQWIPGKVFDGSAPCGPALVSPDEAGPHELIEFSLQLNGETMQSASTGDLIFNIPQLLAHLSTLMTLEPGDIVSTGTPAGVGSVRKPRVWLAPGDEILIDSPTLGTLRTTIAAA